MDRDFKFGKFNKFEESSICFTKGKDKRRVISKPIVLAFETSYCANSPEEAKKQEINCFSAEI